jgi:biotin transport system substrate-specific component
VASVELPGTSAAFVERFVSARERFFHQRYEQWTVGVGLAFGFAALTGLAAQVAVHTPYSPVPITLQVFTVLVAGVVLGYRWGTLSQVLYVLLGAFAIPWYAPPPGFGAFSTGGMMGGGLGGVAQVTGAYGGYLIAFPIAAFLIGWLSDRHPKARGLFPEVGLMMVAVGVIYAFGAVTFWLAYHSPFVTVLNEAVLLFIPVDLAKAAVAGVVGTTVTPKRPFGPEDPAAGAFRRWWPIPR